MLSNSKAYILESSLLGLRESSMLNYLVSFLAELARTINSLHSLKIFLSNNHSLCL